MRKILLVTLMIFLLGCSNKNSITPPCPPFIPSDPDLINFSETEDPDYLKLASNFTGIYSFLKSSVLHNHRCSNEAT